MLLSLTLGSLATSSPFLIHVEVDMIDVARMNFFSSRVFCFYMYASL